MAHCTVLLFHSFVFTNPFHLRITTCTLLLHHIHGYVQFVNTPLCMSCISPAFRNRVLLYNRTSLDPLTVHIAVHHYSPFDSIKQFKLSQETAEVEEKMADGNPKIRAAPFPAQRRRTWIKLGPVWLSLPSKRNNRGRDQDSSPFVGHRPKTEDTDVTSLLRKSTLISLSSL